MTVLNNFVIANPANPDIIQNEADGVYNNENHMVVWSDEKYGANYYITAARVTPAGAVLDTGVCISSAAGSSEARPQIAFDGTRCLAVWTKTGVAFQGRFINSAGQPEGPVLSVGSSNVGGASIAFDGTNYLVVYQAGSWPVLNIYGQFISPAGTLVGSPVTIAADNGDTLRWPDVVFDGTNYFAVWMSGPNSPGPNYIHGRGITPSGTFTGPAFTVSSNTGQMRWWPVVGASDSNYLVAWGQGGTPDIYGNVDVDLVSVSESPAPGPADPGPAAPTIFAESFPEFRGVDCRVYDSSGRLADRNALGPGAYFVEIEGAVRYKVIKLR